MFIPVGTDRPRTKSPWLVYALIVVNTRIFLGMQVFLESRGESAVGRFYMEYAVVRDGFEWHQLLTSAFLHGGWMHLIGNMLVLAALGCLIARRLSSVGLHGPRRIRGLFWCRLLRRCTLSHLLVVIALHHLRLALAQPLVAVLCAESGTRRR